MPADALNVTIRCSDCGRTLAVYYRVPQKGRAMGRLQGAGHDLLEWHRSLEPTCSASGTSVGAGFPKEPGPLTT